MLDKQNLGRVFVYGSPVDFRKGHNGLQAIVKQAGFLLWEGDVIVFFSRCGRKTKVLVADNTGLWLHYKVLSRGRFQQLCHLMKGDTSQIQACELDLLLSGSSYVLQKQGIAWSPQ